MKRLVTLLLAVLLVLSLTGCSQTFVRIGEKSEIYTEEDIEEAFDVALKEFRREFDGCTLIEMGYAGDETRSEQKEWAAQYKADECIILICSFETDGTAGPLNPNSTYENYEWILTRSYGGKWTVQTAGYC